MSQLTGWRDVAVVMWPVAAMTSARGWGGPPSCWLCWFPSYWVLSPPSSSSPSPPSPPATSDWAGRRTGGRATPPASHCSPSSG